MVSPILALASTADPEAEVPTAAPGFASALATEAESREPDAEPWSSSVPPMTVDIDLTAEPEASPSGVPSLAFVSLASMPSSPPEAEPEWFVTPDTGISHSGLSSSRPQPASNVAVAAPETAPNVQTAARADSEQSEAPPAIPAAARRAAMPASGQSAFALATEAVTHEADAPKVGVPRTLRASTSSLPEADILQDRPSSRTTALEWSESTLTRPRVTPAEPREGPRAADNRPAAAPRPAIDALRAVQARPVEAPTPPAARPEALVGDAVPPPALILDPTVRRTLTASGPAAPASPSPTGIASEGHSASEASSPSLSTSGPGEQETSASAPERPTSKAGEGQAPSPSTAPPLDIESQTSPRPEEARPPASVAPLPTSAPAPEAAVPGATPTDPVTAEVATIEGAPTLAAEVASGSRPTSASAPASAIPARLAVPTWLGPLASATAQGVEVALAEGDGNVRLQTERGADGLTVVVRFSDPELGALAGLHLRQITDALEAHFAEPVRLSLDQPGADGEGTPSERGRPAGPEAEGAPDPPPPATPLSSRPLGRTEWIA